MMMMAVCLAMPADASNPASALRKRLLKLEKRGIMIGHQDDPFYGTTWKWDRGRSDVKEVCGDWPAVMGFELGNLELDSARNLDGVPFDRMREEIRNQYERGGICTISWHPTNPTTGKNAWDPSGRPVGKILRPMTVENEIFDLWLNRVAKFLLSLKTGDGKPIPVIFRPWHEMSGGWFWWGKDSCAPEEYQKLYRRTIDFLRQRGIEQCLYAYSPGGDPNETAVNFMKFYPGDNYVDLMGCDLYGNESKDKYIKEMRHELEVVCKVAKKHKKIAIVAETGSRNTPDPTWFTTGLWAAVKDFPISYVLLWRNAWDQPTENFGPAPEKPCADDFRVLYKEPRSLFLKDIK